MDKNLKNLIKLLDPDQQRLVRDIGTKKQWYVINEKLYGAEVNFIDNTLKILIKGHDKPEVLLQEPLQNFEKFNGGMELYVNKKVRAHVN
jgi:hypothetical protein